MAQRRLFSPDIICSDDFLEMPTSSRDLYVQLAIRADDDGFISPRGIMKLLGSSEDDLKVLVAKRFLLEFGSGVIVIKHWFIHNTIRRDRYKSTRYLEEKSSLRIKENGAYTEYSEDGVKLLPSWQPNGNQMAAQVKLSKDKLISGAEPPQEKYTIESEEPIRGSDDVIKAFKEVNPSYMSLLNRKPQHDAAKRLIAIHGLKQVLDVIGILVETNKLPFFSVITTPVQLESDWGKLQAKVQKHKIESAPKSKGRGLA